MITYVERLIALPDVPEYVAARTNGNPTRSGTPTMPTVYRWARLGVRGHRLETQLIGNKLFTSYEALDRFFSRCADSPVEKAAPKNPGMSKEEARRLIP